MKNKKYRNKITGEIAYLNPNLVDLNIYDLSNKLEVTVRDQKGNTFNVFNKNPKYLNNEYLPVTSKYTYKCEFHGLQKNLPEYKRNKLKPIPEKYKIYCPKCHEYYMSDQYIPTTLDIQNCKKFLENFVFFSSLQYTAKYFIKIIPQFYKCILFESSFLDKNVKFSDRIYVVKNNIKNIPICNFIGCTEKKHFLKSTMGISEYCDKHIHSNSISKGENEIVEWIKTIYFGKIIQSFRSGGKEIDIFIPELNLGIEYNGLWWHGEKYRNKHFHYEKWKYFNDKNIKLITIWEDDWKHKSKLIKSILQNQLKLNLIKIYARKVKIKKLNYLETKIFLDNNHIQGFCSSSIRLGLFYNNELVSLMTFGKKRMILKSKSENNQFELLRFCNKQNTSVIGGASKLFKHFLNNYNPHNIISYANLDISNGKLYEILGFTNMGHTGLNYWWVKDKRYHRSNFMKHNLVANGADPNKTETIIMNEKGYWKIYGSGNIKFLWNKTN